MRGIGLTELLVLLGVFVVLLPAAAIGAVLWFFVKRGRQQPVIPSRSCGSCGQRIPDIGSFCPIFGQKIV